MLFRGQINGRAVRTVVVVAVLVPAASRALAADFETDPDPGPEAGRVEFSDAQGTMLTPGGKLVLRVMARYPAPDTHGLLTVTLADANGRTVGRSGLQVQEGVPRPMRVQLDARARRAARRRGHLALTLTTRVAVDGYPGESNPAHPGRRHITVTPDLPSSHFDPLTGP